MKNKNTEQFLMNLDNEVIELNHKKETAEQIIKDADSAKKEARENIKQINERKTKIAEIKQKTEAAKRQLEEAENEYYTVQAEEANNNDNENHNKKKGIIIGFIGVGFLAALTAGAIYISSRESKTGKLANKTNKSIEYNTDTQATSLAEETSETNIAKFETIKSEETTIANTEEETQAVLEYEQLDNDNFELLVANYSNKYKDNYQNLNTEDLMKFIAIANIDKLVEDNQILASELFKEEPKEEYLNDAAKVIGATVMNNFIVWNETKSTEGFIRVSEAISGEQQERMLTIEEYTDKIAEAVNNNNQDLVNEIVSDFLTDLNSGSLSKLDDGVGFAAQINIAIISDGIAKDYLNQQNFDMFQILKTSEKYVSNIFRVYDNCNSKTYTK